MVALLALAVVVRAVGVDENGGLLPEKDDQSHLGSTRRLGRTVCIVIDAGVQL
jgi:hypothetical protein